MLRATDRSSRRPGALLFALLLTLPPLLLHARHLGPGRIPYLRDLSRTHLPVKSVAVEEMRSGRLPLWNPGHGAGSPLLANPNFFHLHPVSLLYLALPYPLAFSLGLALLSVTGALGTALWLRLRGVSRAGAALGAWAFALGGLGASLANLYNLMASYSALPWALAASTRLGARPDRRGCALLAVALASTLAGGEPGAWGWAILLALATGAAGSRPSALRHLAAAALSLGLASLQLLPLAEVTSRSVRGLGFSLEQSAFRSLAPHRLLELVWPWPHGNPLAPGPPDAVAPPFAWLGAPLFFSLYLGALCLSLAVLGGVREGRRGVGLAVLAALSVALALGDRGPLFPALWRLLPPLHGFRYPEKLVLGFFLAAAAFSGRGLDALRQRWPRLPAALLPALLAAELLAAHLCLVPGAPAAAFLEPPPLVERTERGGSPRVYFWLERQRWVPRDAELLAFHLAYQRAAVPPAGVPFGLSYVFDPDPDALDPVRMADLGRLAHRSLEDRRRILRRAAVGSVLSPVPLDLHWLEPLGGSLYRLRDPAPYARLVSPGAVRPAASAAAALELLADPAFPDADVAWEGEPPPATAEASPPEEVRWTRPEPGRIRLEARGPGLLVVAESFDPGWRARIDGRAAPVGAADLAFLGVVLPDAREHQVELRYRPRGVDLGGALSGGSALLALLLLPGRRLRGGTRSGRA